MKNKIIYLIAGLMIVSTPILSADDKKPKEERREKEGAADPEKRREEMRKAAEELGLKPDELRNLSPEERRQKFVEASNAKITELTKKKTDGTITEEETQLLEKLEKRKKAHNKGEGKPERREKPEKK
jgi:hypothetical protein